MKLVAVWRTILLISWSAMFLENWLTSYVSLPFASGNATETQDTEVCIMACPKSLWVTVIKGHDHLHSCLVSLGFTGTDRLGTFKVSLWTFHCNLIDMTPDLGIVFFVFLLITGITLRALGGGGS
jgi:hypothetical protein